MLPGGFSYGDYLRCGAIARFAPVMQTVIEQARRGLPVLGICNGFQVLCESHLLPGALIRNDVRRFVCRDQRLRIDLDGHRVDRRLPGRPADNVSRSRTARAGTSRTSAPWTSWRRRAGWWSAISATTRTAPPATSPASRTSAGNVVGLMPHPEHAIDPLTGPTADGLGFFTSILAGLGARRDRHASSTPRRRRTSRSRTPSSGSPPTSTRGSGTSSAGARPPPSSPSTRSCGASTARTSRARSTCDSSGRRQPPTDRLLAGIGENAGVVDVGDGWAVTFKVESHNHPSYVEPYQGAATGVGGIVRDILAMGARPVAVLDPLRFGPADAPDTARVLPGVVAGIGGYGNCLGLPNIGGEVVFDRDVRRQPAGQRALRRRAAQGLDPARARLGRGQQGDPLRREDRPGRHRRRLRAGQRDFRRRQAEQAAQRPGRRPVRREGAHRVLPGAVRGRPGRRHPGPRRRRAVLRAHRAGQRRRRRDARRPRPGAAAGAVDGPGGGAGQRVTGADVRGRHAGPRSTTSSPSARSGRCWPPSSAR